MKTAHFLVFLFLTSLVYSQEIPSQKYILDLENINLTEDFKLNNTIKTPVRVIENWYRTGTTSRFDHQRIELFDFDPVTFKIVTRKYRFARVLKSGYTNLVTYNFSYYKNLLNKIIFEETNRPNYESEYYFNPDNDNKVFLIDVKKNNNNKIIEYEYPNDTTIVKTVKKITSEGDENFFSRTNFVLKDGLITVKEITNTIDPDNTWVTEYKYNDKGLIEKLDDYQGLVKSFEDTSFKNYEYLYYDSGLVKQEIYKLSIEFVQVYEYEYIYDEYENWITKFKILVQDVVDIDKPRVTEIFIRNIEYSDQKVTGFMDLNDSEIIDYLSKYK